MIDRIYLGDRAVTGLEIDSRSSLIRIKINLISRLPKNNSEWGFYNNEDIENGFLVFSGISYLEISPSGIIPGDYNLTQNKDSGQFIIRTIGQPNEMYKGDKESLLMICFHDSWLENKDKELVG